MDSPEYRRHFELEERHWWFAGRRAILLRLLRRRLELNPGLAILDVGCGTGYNLRAFERAGRPAGCDISAEALGYCRRRGLARLVRSDVQALPFKPESFDGVLLLDVLYHRWIRSDGEALAEVAALLRPGGFLLVTDSAFNALRSTHDQAFGARERYTRRRLRRGIEAAGLRVIKASYFNALLFPFVAAVRLGGRLRRSAGPPSSSLRSTPRLLNAAFERCLRLEAVLLDRISFPFGSSIVCLAVKR